MNDKISFITRAEIFLAKVLLLPIAIPVYLIGSYYQRKEHNAVNQI